MNSHERFRAVMRFEPFDRLPLIEWAPWWDQTIARWRGEGLASDLTDAEEIRRHFGLDTWLQDWWHGRGPDCPAPEHHGAGIIASMDDYERILPHLYPWPVVDVDRWTRWRERQERGEAVLWFTLEGFFWFPRVLLGIERHLRAFYEQPELIHRINTDLTEHSLRVIDAVCAIASPDFMTFAEDMSFNHGPMLSRDLFDAFLKPYYDRVVPCLKEHGVLAFVDSDGDVTAMLPWLDEAGIEGVLPLERQAGVDVAALRECHATMRFIGCFDKMTMSRGEGAMRAEFERLLPVAARGGLAISCDHQTPPGVSLEDYRLYLRLFREYADEAGRLSRRLPAPHEG